MMCFFDTNQKEIAIGEHQMYWPSVTARHLLTHTSGLGKVPPGTQFEQLGDAEDSYCLLHEWDWVRLSEQAL